MKKTKEKRDHHCLNFSQTTWELLERLADEKTERLGVKVSISSLIALWAKENENK